MRAMMSFCAAALCVVAPAAAEEREPHFASFDVSQSPAPRGRDMAQVNVAGAPVAFNAYGRQAHARRFGVMRQMTEAHRLGQAFDPATKPAFVTLEASVRF